MTTPTRAKDEAMGRAWGIEQTEYRNWIGPLRTDGKIDEIICSTDRGNLTPEALARNDAYAVKIVTAVNSYDDMLAALKAVAVICCVRDNEPLYRWSDDED